MGGGAIIVAIAAYYLYVVKPAAQLPPKTRDLEDAPILAQAAPIVAPVASLGYNTQPPCLAIYFCSLNGWNLWSWTIAVLLLFTDVIKVLFFLQGSISRRVDCAIDTGF